MVARKIATKKGMTKAATGAQIAADQEPSILNVIQALAVNPNVDVEKLSALLEMQKEIMNEEKHRVFTSAMVDAQGGMPAIAKTLRNDQTKSMYSDLSDIIKVAQPIYTAAGLSVMFSEGSTDKESHVRVLADVSHRNGYTRQFFLDQPIDNAGIAGKVNKTATHAKASAFSYGRRYLHGMIFNLAFGDGDDDDGNAAGGLGYEVITEKQAKELLEALDRSTKNIGDIIAYADKAAKDHRVTSLADVPAKGFAKIIEGIIANPIVEVSDVAEV